MTTQLDLDTLHAAERAADRAAVVAREAAEAARGVSGDLLVLVERLQGLIDRLARAESATEAVRAQLATEVAGLRADLKALETRLGALELAQARDATATRSSARTAITVISILFGLAGAIVGIVSLVASG